MGTLLNKSLAIVILATLASSTFAVTDAAELPAASGPKQSTANLPPLAEKPEVWRSDLLPVATRPAASVSHLPRAALGRDPALADAAKLRALRLRPSVDIPQVAVDSTLRLPAPFLRPATPLASSPSPDAAQLAWPGAPTFADPGRATPTSDPAQDSARDAMLSVRPDVPQKPAPFLRVNLPDPEELVAPMRLEETPPDNDPPAFSLEMPPQPMLPVLPQVKK
jgi:hypothetical protein